jgi:hypothetical protein
VGPPDSSVVHRAVTVHCPVRHLASALTLRAQSRTVHCSLLLLQTTVGAVAVTPLGSPDSPVNYSGGAPRKPEASKLELIHPGAPDSLVRQTRAAFGFLCSFDLNSFFYICIGLL